jgi:hypothetical protein
VDFQVLDLDANPVLGLVAGGEGDNVGAGDGA